MDVVRVSDRPLESVTVTVTVYSPAAAYVWASGPTGLVARSIACIVPSPHSIATEWVSSALPSVKVTPSAPADPRTTGAVGTVSDVISGAIVRLSPMRIGSWSEIRYASGAYSGSE